MKKWIVLSLFVVGACGGDTDNPAQNNAQNNTNNPSNNTTPPNGCTPDQSQWAAIEPIVQTHCAGCHGESPDYGAPHNLATYDALMIRDLGITRAELGARRVGQGTMPPIGMPGMSPEDIQAFVDWATCGEGEFEETPRLTVNRPVFLGPSEAPQDWEYIDLLAPDFEVSPEWSNRYQCFTFEIPFGEDRFIRRMDIVEDKSSVLHHVVLLRDNEKNAPLEPHSCLGMPAGSDYLYAWAPGTGAIHFEDGGLRAKPGERFVMQIHYNNGAGIPDLRDSSGIRLHHGPVEGTEYGMVAIGPVFFSVPGRTELEVSGTCTISETTTLLAGMPHMHEVGKAFSQDITRADGTEENLIELANWSFETQLVYDTPFTLQPGDTIKTRCTFDNPGTAAVTAGPNTEDEMCFNFMYVTPPPTSRYCDDVEQSEITDVDYTKGMCAISENALENPDLVTGRFVVGSVGEMTGGDLEAGVYQLKEIEIWRETAATPIGDIDLERSKILARGQLIYEDGEITFDADILSELMLTTGQTFGQPTNVSLRVARDMTQMEVLAGEAVCSQAPASIPFEVSGNELRMSISGNAFNVSFESLYVFEKVL